MPTFTRLAFDLLFTQETIFKTASKSSIQVDKDCAVR